MPGQTTPGVTVVIPHYGSPQHALALASQVRDQPTEHVVQVVVVDDRSPEPFPDLDGVEVVRRARNGGYGAAVNSGVERATQPLLLLLNSDLSLPDRFVDGLVAAAGPHLPGVVAPAVRTRGELERTGRRFPAARHQAAEWLAVLGRHREAPWFGRLVGQLPLPPALGWAEADWVAGVALLVPTADFRAVGGFDERYFMYAEEVDLQRRLHDRGLRSVQLGSPEVTHAGGGSTDPARARRWLMRSRLRYAATWGGRRRLQLALTGATAVNLATNGARRAAGREVAPVRVARDELALIWRSDGEGSGRDVGP